MATRLLVGYTPPNLPPPVYTNWLNQVAGHGWDLVAVAYNPVQNLMMNYFHATIPSASADAVHALSVEGGQQ
ncbi:MAG TPA: hypothetical protein VF771_17450 [Longimicrobiaceae bacterium]